VDCYVTVKGSSVRRELTCCQNRTHSSQVRERAIQRGNGVGFSPGKRSLPAGKVGANTTSSEVGGKRLVSHPVGAMDCYVTVQESGRAAHPARSVVPDCAGDEMDCGVHHHPAKGKMISAAAKHSIGALGRICVRASAHILQAKTETDATRVQDTQSVVSQSIQWGDARIHNGPRIWGAAHQLCTVATDYARCEIARSRSSRYPDPAAL
jgi:hypothetical protein